ncbi:MAG: 6-pyruvoyl trahydropterin synthase family protein [Bacteroidia bacterium]|jgi:6-pyruvoyltetrahydropterin/6-carboxytetrahydropterin synthase
MIYVTRKEHFNAAHKLHREDWTEEKNLAVFGKCANANWHGHNFDLFVTVKGNPNPETGFVIDLKLLSELIREHIVEALDHKNLNLDVSFMKGIMPSTENLAIKIWEILDPYIKTEHCVLHCVKLYETENNFVEYYG